MTEAQLQEYSRWCGPAVVANVMNTTRLDAARALAAIEAPTGHRVRSTEIDTIAEAIGGVVIEVRKDPTGGGGWYPLNKKCPTLASWLRSNPNTEAIVRASNHFFHVGHGMVLGGTGLGHGTRGRVNYAIIIKEG